MKQIFRPIDYVVAIVGVIVLWLAITFVVGLLSDEKISSVEMETEQTETLTTRDIRITE